MKQKTDKYGVDNEVASEAVIRQALIEIWDKARKSRFPAIGEMEISVFDAKDGFVLLSLLNGTPKCEKSANLVINYVTSDGSEINFDYKGTLAAAQELKAFLPAQIRAAADKDVTMIFTLGFPDGLGLDDASRDAFIARLDVAGAASAYVKARARSQGGN